MYIVLPDGRGLAPSLKDDESPFMMACRDDFLFGRENQTWQVKIKALEESGERQQVPIPCRCPMNSGMG